MAWKLIACWYLKKVCVAGLLRYAFAEDGAASVNSVKEHGWRFGGKCLVVRRLTKIVRQWVFSFNRETVR